MDCMKEFDICVVGSCVQDVVAYAARFPQPGESIRGHKIKLNCGGKGANQAVTAARLGARVAMVGMVGDDMFGHGTVENFKNAGVNVDHLGITKEAETGAANIYVEDSGENTIIVVLGANLKLTIHDVENAEDVIRKSKVLMCQFEIEPEVTLAALKLGKKHSVTTILNTAPGLPDVDPELFKYADIVCPNENEAAIISGQPVNASDVQSCVPAIDFILDQGARCVMVTLGSNGCVFKTKQMATIGHVEAVKVKAVDTVGAGDCFMGSIGYFTALFPGSSLEERIRRANQIASISVQRHGTQPSYPRASELDESLFRF